MSDSTPTDSAPEYVPLRNRFRGFCPVVVDVETGGFDQHGDALLEIAAVIIHMDHEGFLHYDTPYNIHVQPFEGANMDPASLEINGIDPYHPLRIALPEKEALKQFFQPIRSAVKSNQCKRAVLVGHNAFFDLGFINAAVKRTNIKNNPFHPFSNFDTVTLGAMAYGQTVLSRIAQAAEIDFDSAEAHSARYDTLVTAQIFCDIMNKWHRSQQNQESPD